MASALSRARDRLAARQKQLTSLKAAVKKAAAKVAETTRTVKRLSTPKTQRMSKQGVDFLIREEGVRNFAYNDPAGHATFGVGHLLHRGPCTNSDFAKWGSQQHPKPASLAKQVLAKDLVRYETAVRQAIGGKKLKQQEFDACVSLCFNIGTGGFAGSSVARLIRLNSPQPAANAFLLWDTPSMLKPRRERERRLFLTGVYR